MMLGFLCAALLGQSAEPPRLPDAAERLALRATVRVHNRARDKVGSGVVIGRVGPAIYVLTAAHLVDGTDAVEIRFPELDSQKVAPRELGDVTVVARTKSAVEDLALLRFAGGGDFACLSLRKDNLARLKIPSQAFSVGFADGKLGTVTAESIVNASMVKKRGADEAAQFWKCKALPVPGRSGGPLLDPEGSLLGVCSGGDARASYYTHHSEVRRFLIRNGLRTLAE
jgi:S1-C subfamily serine protease